MKKLKILLLILITFSVLTPFIINNLNSNLRNVEEKTQKDQIKNNHSLNQVKILKNSKTWEKFNFIHITGANWSIASTYDWCDGSGTLKDPYVIKNINIGGGTSGSVILIENSLNVYFEINNCTVRNSGSGLSDAGIKLYNTSNGKIINNDYSQNKNGIYLSYSDNITIVGNTANDIYDGAGIHLEYSNDNIISGNNAKYNVKGMELYYSEENLISENTLNNNDIGIYLRSSANNTISGNIASCNDFHGILLDGSKNNSVSKNTFTANFQNGIYLSYSDNNTVSRNTLNNNFIGISLKTSDNNTIRGNLFKYNQVFGINIIDSKCQNNLIYFNSIQRYLGDHAKDSGTNTKWNKLGIGNFWNTYISPDSNNDGIVDTTYSFNGVVDNYPLVESPVHDGEKIHIDDSSMHAWNWNKTAKLKLWCSGSGIPTDPFIIQDLIINSGGTGSSILIENSNVYFIIENCKLYNSKTEGIKLYNTSNGKIINNDISLNKNGITLEQSNNNNVLGNIIYKNNDYAILLSTDSNNNTIMGNNANYNKYGIGLFLYCNNNNISGNIANNNDCGIGLIISDDNTVIGNTANKNIYGIYLLYSNNNTVSGNYLVINVFFIEDDECIKNIIKDNICYTTILPSGINNVKIEPYGVDDVDVDMEIALDHETEVIFSAFNKNNIEDAPLDNELIFMNLQLNDTNNLNQSINTPIKFSLEFDNNKYIPLEVLWFNESANGERGAWEELAFTDLGNGKIVISVNHTAIFAIVGEIKSFPPSRTKSDDVVFDLLFLILIGFICSLTLVTTYSIYYHRTRIQKRAKLTKKDIVMRKPLVKSLDKKVVKSENLKGYVENKNLLKILKDKNVLENSELFNDLEITAISDDFWKKITNLDLDDKEKRIFILDMLAFTPEEREEIIDGMLRLGESDSENNNQEEYMQGCFSK